MVSHLSRRALRGLLAALIGVSALRAEDSVYPLRLEDPAAVYFEPERFPTLAAGGDVTALLQDAIDGIAEAGTFGILYVPSGTYLLSDTVYVWKGVRIIGYGPTRPRFVLEDASLGFDGSEPKHLFHFADDMPTAGEPIESANPGTFYSALANVVIALGEDNPGAVGVRAHFAQHCFINHVRFEIGDALAGLQKVGNLFRDCEFIGGEYGILTTKPSPSWPFVLLDSTFRGQRQAAILTEEAGMTVVRCHFSDTPRAIEMRADRSEELVVEDSVFERVSDAAILISNEHNARTQVNLLAVQCAEVPVIARFRQSGRAVPAPEGRYRIDHFSHGVHLDGLGQTPAIETRLTLGEPPPPDRLVPPTDPARALPPPASWVDVTTLGAVGDGEFDNTALLQKAIETHAALFFPTGRYRISDTLRLRPESALIGMSPITTQLVVRDREAAFDAGNTLKAVVETGRGGAPILSGLGIDPGAINRHAVALKWRGGEASLVDDVRFLGGHGTFDTAGNYLPIYNNNRSADSDPARRWDAMPASLWVTDGGGGTFRNLWTPSPFAHAGMIVEDTDTPGWVYQLSSEHHLRYEVIVRRARNWKFYALQFEEESHEGRHTLPLLIEDSAHLAFHNTYLYRVSRTFTPYPVGILVENSEDLHFHGIHAYGPTKFTFDATLRDTRHDAVVATREIAYLAVPGEVRAAPEPPPYTLLAEGFNHLDSPEVDSRGRLYFVDAFHQTIYRWDPADAALRRVLELPLEPEQILLEDDAHLLVFTRLGKVYRVVTSGRAATLEELAPVSGPPPAAGRFGLPLTRWRDTHDFQEVTQEAKPLHFRAGELVVPAETSFIEAGPRTSYFRTLDLIRAYDLGTAAPGEQILVSDEFDQKTWRFTVTADGRLRDPELFAEEGEAGVLQLPGGEVVILAGDLLCYSPEGTLQRRLPVPGRATGIALGADGETLFILARTRLYSLPLAALTD